MLKVIAPLVYLLLCVLSAPVMADATPAPNILLLIADDLGYNDSGIYQDITHQKSVASMPALEALAKQGIRYTRFYTESTCSASRVALLTGQYPARQGFMPVARGISPDVITLPEFFKARGYATHLVGKWHMGEINKEALPSNQGFDTVFGFLNQWMLKGPDTNGKPQLKSPTYFNPWLLDVSKGENSYKKYDGHLEDILTARTVNLINDKKSKQQPWFIYHAFFAPHTPLEPAERFAARFDNTPDGKYNALLAQMDDSVLQILSALKETKQWDNTIIIFVSDNGSPEKHGNSNAPFSGGKAEYEEGGIRTPLIVKWQKDAPSSAPSIHTDVVSIMDIYPSLVAATSGKNSVHTRDFKSLDGIPSLVEKNTGQRNVPLYWLSYGTLSALSADGNTRLIKQWDTEHFTNSELFQYDKQQNPLAVGDSFLEKFLESHAKQKDQLFNEFLQWRDDVRKVPVTFITLGKQGAGKISGRNFLRTPINPSYAIAFSFTAADVNKKQTLLYQQGAMDVTLESGNLLANINGLKVEQKNIQLNQCYSIVLSGEFYDRYSTVQSTILESHLHLIVNGGEVDTASGEIASFEKIDISAPTFVGMRDEKDKNIFSGHITEPKIFLTQLLPQDKPVSSGIADVIQGLCH